MRLCFSVEKTKEAFIDSQEFRLDMAMSYHVSIAETRHWFIGVDV